MKYNLISKVKRILLINESLGNFYIGLEWWTCQTWHPCRIIRSMLWTCSMYQVTVPVTGSQEPSRLVRVFDCLPLYICDINPITNDCYLEIWLLSSLQELLLCETDTLYCQSRSTDSGVFYMRVPHSQKAQLWSAYATAVSVSRMHATGKSFTRNLVQGDRGEALGFESEVKSQCQLGLVVLRTHYIRMIIILKWNHAIFSFLLTLTQIIIILCLI